MTFHVVGLPSNKTSSYTSCAFTSLTANFIKMMKSLGHKVIHYGVGCDVECDEDVVVSNPEPMDWSGRATYWSLYNSKIISEITKRKNTKDFVCVICGILNQPLLQIPQVQVVEFAIGYNFTFSPYRVFASYAHMHKVWGTEGGYDPDGRWCDTVIPHYLNPDDFTPQFKKADYYLYIGRLTQRKGLQIAIDTCKVLNTKLIIAGVGDYQPKADNVLYAGQVKPEMRLKLYRNAIATFAPTQYVEPFNMTVIESQMCGTPVITTDFGAFTENVKQGVGGFRCRTFDDFVKAATLVKDLDLEEIRNYAVETWGLNNIKHKYQRYFDSLLDLWTTGWYTLHT
jgi:glycosyltransferase involved in cell wall biosynthesis